MHANLKSGTPSADDRDGDTADPLYSDLKGRVSELGLSWDDARQTATQRVQITDVDFPVVLEAAELRRRYYEEFFQGDDTMDIVKPRQIQYLLLYTHRSS